MPKTVYFERLNGNVGMGTDDVNKPFFTNHKVRISLIAEGLEVDINGEKEVIRPGDTGVVNGQPFGGSLPELKTKLLTEVFFLAASGGGDFFIEKTKAEVDTLIGQGELIPGVTYKITGTTGQTGQYLVLFLKALSASYFAVDGEGLFYTPDFNVRGVYSDINAATEFGSYRGEVVQENGAGEGDIIKYGGQYFVAKIDILVFDEETSINFGNYSLVQQGVWNGDIDGTLIRNNVVIWNGNHYVVINASKLGQISPDQNEEAFMIIPNEPSSLTKGMIPSVDIIKYDYENDKLLYREDIFGNAVVVEHPEQMLDFQWGNPSVNNNTVKGHFRLKNQSGTVQFNTIEVNSFADCGEGSGTIQYIYVGVGVDQPINLETGVGQIKENRSYMKNIVLLTDGGRRAVINLAVDGSDNLTLDITEF